MYRITSCHRPVRSLTRYPSHTTIPRTTICSSLKDIRTEIDTRISKKKVQDQFHNQEVEKYIIELKKNPPTNLDIYEKELRQLCHRKSLANFAAFGIGNLATACVTAGIFCDKSWLGALGVITLIPTVPVFICKTRQEKELHLMIDAVEKIKN